MYAGAAAAASAQDPWFYAGGRGRTGRGIRALQDLPCQVLLSVGQEIDPAALGPLPNHIQVETFVDQIAVLQVADVFLTHCGMNSVSEALYCGVPLLLYPQTAEQGGVARRVQQLGAGIWLKSTRPAAIRTAVEKLLMQPECRQAAQRVRAEMRSCGGATQAAQHILDCCKNNI